MTAPARTQRSLEQWLDDLITAAPDDRVMVGVEGIAAGVAYTRVLCTRCNTRLNWISATSHVKRVEASYRFRTGEESARLHQPGDLVVLPMAEQPGGLPWPTSTCGYCGAVIVWTTTNSGKAMPVDAEPNAKGNVILTRHPDGGENRPLAVVLHTEYDRATTDGALIHTSHIQTCEHRPKSASSRRRAHAHPRRSTR